MSLTANRNTPEMELIPNLSALEYGVKSGAKLYAGAAAGLDTAGRIVRMSADTTLIALGAVEKLADNSAGGDNAITARVKPGIWRWANGDSITSASRGLVCYFDDDQTVYSTDGGATRPKAGVIVDVDSQGVWVATGFSMLSNPGATPAGTLQKKTVTLTHGAVTATPNTDGTAFQANIGTALPAGAIVVGVQVTNTTDWSGGGLASMTIQAGVASADLDSLVASTDVFTGAGTGVRTGVEGDEIGHMQGAVQLVAVLTPDNATKTSEATAGQTTIDVYYFVAF
jgi:hypothetical protein